MKKFFLIPLIFLCALTFAETFRFKYHKNDRYKIRSTVNETVKLNNQLYAEADILNKISVHITDVAEGSGKLEAQFLTSEKVKGGGNTYAWSEEYPSVFWRDSFGRYTISDQYYMPVVRHVPSFPEREIKLNETWTALAEEAHDLRRQYGLDKAFRFPIEVNYEYKEKLQQEGKILHRIAISYTIFYQPKYKGTIRQAVPLRISGWSKQDLLWDNNAGRPHSYSEEFLIIIDDSGGRSVEYSGTAEAKVIASQAMDRKKMADDIREDLKDIEDAQVREDEDGIVISLENIQFEADSDKLRESEKAKLDRIGTILQKYSKRDIMVSGHTALAGTAAGRLRLSLRRAQVVGEYLIKNGYKKAVEMMIRGLGAEEPIADNDTEEGMRKNRRVEIKILEN